MDTSALTALGLSPSEIKVYLCLNQIGTSRAGEIIRKSNLQSPVVHRAFHSLSEKGIVTTVNVGKIKEYQVVDPESLVNLVEHQKENLLKIVPLLKQDQMNQKNAPIARVYQGKKGVRELIYSLLEKDPEKLLVYGGPLKSIEVLGEFFWDNFHKRRLHNRISGQFILHNSLKKRAKLVNAMSQTKVRLTSANFEELTETFVSQNKVAIVLYSDIPFGFLIEEKSIAKSYQKFFELMWESSKSVSF